MRFFGNCFVKFLTSSFPLLFAGKERIRYEEYRYIAVIGGGAMDLSIMDTLYAETGNDFYHHT